MRAYFNISAGASVNENPQTRTNFIFFLSHLDKPGMSSRKVEMPTFTETMFGFNWKDVGKKLKKAAKAFRQTPLAEAISKTCCAGRQTGAVQ